MNAGSFEKDVVTHARVTQQSTKRPGQSGKTKKRQGKGCLTRFASLERERERKGSGWLKPVANRAGLRQIAKRWRNTTLVYSYDCTANVVCMSGGLLLLGVGFVFRFIITTA